MACLFYFYYYFSCMFPPISKSTFQFIISETCWDQTDDFLATLRKCWAWKIKMCHKIPAKIEMAVSVKASEQLKRNMHIKLYSDPFNKADPLLIEFLPLTEAFAVLFFCYFFCSFVCSSIMLLFGWQQKMCYDSITFQSKWNICSWSEICVCVCQQKNVFEKHQSIHWCTHTHTTGVIAIFVAFTIVDATAVIVLRCCRHRPASRCWRRHCVRFHLHNLIKF